MRAGAAASLLATANVAVKGAGAINVHDFDWSVVEPSTKLNYTACYDGYKCAKLLVPLDWLDPSNPDRVTLAITARPAVVDESDPSFGGTIITNPGGPGGAGVAFVLRWGEELQRVADGNKKYEILSFDPRGVGLTTPSADCYHDEFARASFRIEDRAIGGPDGGLNVIRRLFSRSEGHGKLCDNGKDGRGFSSTSSVARDMVEIVDKLHELRHGEAGSEQDDSSRRIELRSARDDTPRIQYWGFSYGTVLGRYFASMFPGRVGRMILEAVEDVYDYNNATWSGNLPDVQKALDFFWKSCHEARSRCDLYTDADKSPEDVRDRVRAFMDELDASPVPYISHNTVVTISRQDVLNTLFRALYSPRQDFPETAEVIAAAMRGNYTNLYTGLSVPSETFGCPIDPKPDYYTWIHEAQAAIACGDGEPQTNLTVAEFDEYLQHLTKDSPDFASNWSLIRLACKGWRIRPKYRFAGPWVTPEPDATPLKGKPAASLLFLSSTIDPVTPLRMAKAARKDHPGSGLLVQDNVGHGAIGDPGRCREDYVKKYWEAGEVPPEGIVCKPDCPNPFLDCPRAKVAALGQKGEKRWHPLGLN